MDNDFLKDVFKMYLEENHGRIGEFKYQTQHGYKRVVIKSGNRVLTISDNLKTEKMHVYF